MDINSARYLVSALIQATAIAWALATAIFVFLYQFGKDAFQELMSFVSNEDVAIERTPKNLKTLAFMNIMALLTVVAGILALATIEEPFEIGLTFMTTMIVLTILFSLLTFFSMTFIIRELLKHWSV